MSNQNMTYTLDKNDAFPMVRISLPKGEKILIEPGCMVYRNEGIVLSATLNNGGSGGIFKAYVRSARSGESMYKTEVESISDDALIVIAPSLPGQIVELEVGEKHYFLNDGVFLAMDETVNYSIQRTTFHKALLAGQGGMYVMETNGVGKMIINAYGSLDKIELDGTQTITIDNHHVIAWDSSLNYDIRLETGSIGGSVRTGEGIVNTFSGVGTIYLQTLNIRSLYNAIRPFIPRNHSK